MATELYLQLEPVFAVFNFSELEMCITKSLTFLRKLEHHLAEHMKSCQRSNALYRHLLGYDPQ